MMSPTEETQAADDGNDFVDGVFVYVAKWPHCCASFVKYVVGSVTFRMVFHDQVVVNSKSLGPP